MIKLYVIFCTFLFSGFVNRNQTKPSIIFIITKTHPYCGGANRTEEYLDNKLKKEIAAGEMFYIIKGKENTTNRKVIRSFSMGAANSGCINLPPGIYSIINKFSYQKLIINANNFDRECIEKLWATPLFSFTVYKKKCDTISFNITLPCEYDKPCAKLNNDIPM